MQIFYKKFTSFFRHFQWDQKNYGDEKSLETVLSKGFHTYCGQGRANFNSTQTEIGLDHVSIDQNMEEKRTTT